MRICPNCKKENTDDSFWCKYCKSPLIEKADLGFNQKIQTPELNKNNEEKQITKPEIPIEEIPEEIPPEIKKKITHIILPIIIVTIVIVALIFFMQGKNTPVDETEQFYGKWIEQTEGNDHIYFYSNDDNCEYFKNPRLYQGTYELRNGDASKGEPNAKLLTLSITDNSPGRPYIYPKYTYSFGTTEGIKTLTITNIDVSHGVETITFIKSE